MWTSHDNERPPGINEGHEALWGHEVIFLNGFVHRQQIEGKALPSIFNPEATYHPLNPNEFALLNRVPLGQNPTVCPPSSSGTTFMNYTHGQNISNAIDSDDDDSQDISG